MGSMAQVASGRSQAGEGGQEAAPRGWSGRVSPGFVER